MALSVSVSASTEPLCNGAAGHEITDAINIYTLSDPNTKEIRYVGQTSDVSKRLKNHMRGNGKNSFVYRDWISHLKDKGLKPTLDVIDVVTSSEVDFWERHYISLYRSWGFDLMNIQLGGTKGCVVAEATKKKISQRHLGKTIPRSVLDKTRASTNNFEEHRTRMSGLENPMQDPLCKQKKHETSLKNGSYERTALCHVGNKYRAKPIIQYDKDWNFIKEWDCAKQASDELSICRTSIAGVANGKKWLHTAGGFRWKWKHD